MKKFLLLICTISIYLTGCDSESANTSHDMGWSQTSNTNQISVQERAQQGPGSEMLPWDYVEKGKALIVGLNSLDPATHNGETGTLTESENDLNRISKILEPTGFEINRLQGANATKNAILSGLETAANELRKGDIFIFYFSGQGGKIIDQDGDEPYDQYDETLEAYDNPISDDELRAKLSLFKQGVRVIIMTDINHAGTSYWNQSGTELSLHNFTVTDENNIPGFLLHIVALKNKSNIEGLFTQNMLTVWNNGLSYHHYNSLVIDINNKIALPNDENYAEFYYYGADPNSIYTWNGQAFKIRYTGESLYGVDNGRLYRIDPETGERKRIGTTVFNNVTSITSANLYIFIISDNSLWKVSPFTGAATKFNNGLWDGYTDMTSDGSNLYIIQNNHLLKVDIFGKYKALGSAAWAGNVTMTFSKSDHSLYIIQNSRFHKVDKNTGSWQVRGPAAWGGHAEMVSNKDGVFAIQNRSLHKVYTHSGRWKVIGPYYAWHGFFSMTSVSDDIYSLGNGRLYKVNLSTGNWEAKSSTNWSYASRITSFYHGYGW